MAASASLSVSIPFEQRGKLFFVRLGHRRRADRTSPAPSRLPCRPGPRPAPAPGRRASSRPAGGRQRFAMHRPAVRGPSTHRRNRPRPGCRGGRSAAPRDASRQFLGWGRRSPARTRRSSLMRSRIFMSAAKPVKGFTPANKMLSQSGRMFTRPTNQQDAENGSGVGRAAQLHHSVISGDETSIFGQPRSAVSPQITRQRMGQM